MAAESPKVDSPALKLLRELEDHFNEIDIPARAKSVRLAADELERALALLASVRKFCTLSKVPYSQYNEGQEDFANKLLDVLDGAPV